MTTPLCKKLGAKQGMRAICIDAPTDVMAALEPAGLQIVSHLSEKFDYIHAFAKRQTELENTFASVKAFLGPRGMLWVSWPKNKQLGTDLTLPIVIRIGYTYGLVESSCVSVDTTWSALKWTWPIKGKTYHNSYGQLPREPETNQ